MSLRWPGEPIRRTGLPSASPAARILVLRPPRERPRPWASAPLFPGERRPPADAPARLSSRSSAIPDRLRAKARRGWRPERPSRSSGNSGALRFRSRPIAQADRASARPSGHPEQRVQKPSIVGARTPLALPAAGHKLLKPLPLVVSKHVAIHRRSPKISVESDSRPLENPRALNRHHGLAAERPARPQLRPARQPPRNAALPYARRFPRPALLPFYLFRY